VEPSHRETPAHGAPFRHLPTSPGRIRLCSSASVSIFAVRTGARFLIFCISFPVSPFHRTVLTYRCTGSKPIWNGCGGGLERALRFWVATIWTESSVQGEWTIFKYTSALKTEMLFESAHLKIFIKTNRALLWSLNCLLACEIFLQILKFN